jgi:hypothetical protein
MSKELVEKAMQYFNENDMDNLLKLWHDDIQIIRLMTNEVLLEGKEQIIEANKPYMEEGKVKFEIRNIVELGNIYVTFTELVGMDIERITIYEVINNKFKRTWISQFPKDQKA